MRFKNSYFCQTKIDNYSLIVIKNKFNILLAFYFIVFFLFIPSFFSVQKITAQSSGQKLPHQLKLNTIDSDVHTLVAITGGYETRFSDASTCRTALQTLLKSLQEQAYLAASIDNLKSDSLFTYADLFLGKQYKWLRLNTDSIAPKDLSEAGFRSHIFFQKPLRFSDLLRLQERLLTAAENKGYPFAQVGLKNIVIDEEGNVRADLVLDKYKRIDIDSLIVHGNAKITKRYLQNYLRIKPGQRYNESIIRNIGIRIQELPFVRENQAAIVHFVGESAQVNVFLKKKKANRFNILLGLLPKENLNVVNPGNNNPQRYQITGEGDLNLQNALGAGEIIGLEFKSYPANVRELKAGILYPYLPLLPIGTDARFHLYIRDTLYRDVSAYLGLQYIFKGNNYIKAFFETKTATLLSVDSTKLKTKKILPDMLDLLSNVYGLEYNFEQLDYRINPRKGWLLNMNVGLGFKEVKENRAILDVGESLEDVNFQAQYDSLNQNKFRYQLAYTLNRFWPLGKRATFLTGLQGRYINNIGNLQSNEYHRIGGAKLLRGFDDQSILVPWYHIFTGEFRYLIGQNAYAAAFGDFAYVPLLNDEDDEPGQEINKAFDFPLGFGVGFTFETKAGVFGLSYALGRQQNNPIQFKNGKVHFGYVNYF